MPSASSASKLSTYRTTPHSKGYQNPMTVGGTVLMCSVLGVLQNGRFIVFLNMSALMGASSHMKPTSTMRSESVFPLRFNFPYFIDLAPENILQPITKLLF